MNIINKKCVSTIIGGISGNVTYNGKTIQSTFLAALVLR